VSRYWQRILQEQYALAAPLITNGVNLQRFSATTTGHEAGLKQRYHLTGSPIYLTVGGIEPRKNSIRLLQAFAEILAVYPDAQLVIAGGATLFDYQTYRAQFWQMADQINLALGRSLILPGVIPAADLPALYRCADVFCFPSLIEGWGLVVLEAIASGLPIITSRQPPFTEFLGPDQAAWVDPESIASIRQAMQGILDPDYRRSLITHSQRVLLNFSWLQTARRHLELYQQHRERL
jgi:glycosyltransferase-like protein